MTEQGYFQPKPETKEENQKKLIHLHENIQDFLHNFLKAPEKLRKPKNQS
jgi:hypothetical protein